jgi:hypothetical protein
MLIFNVITTHPVFKTSDMFHRRPGLDSRQGQDFSILHSVLTNRYETFSQINNKINVVHSRKYKDLRYMFC